MNRKIMKLAAGIASTLSVAHVEALPVFAGPSYSTSLGGYTQQDFGSGRPSGNRAGVGRAQVFTTLGEYHGFRAFRWDVDGDVDILGVLGTSASLFTNSSGHGMNASGVSVGYASKYVSNLDKGKRAVRWAANSTTASELNPINTSSTGVSLAEAFNINSSGVSVGYSAKYVSNVDKGTRAVRWPANGAVPFELGSFNLDAAPIGTAQATVINDAGVAAGFSEKIVSGVNVGRRAARWPANSLVPAELGVLSTGNGGSGRSEAFGISDNGTVVGESDVYLNNVLVGERGVRWAANSGTPTELPVPAASAGFYFNSSTMAAINSAGVSVGTATYKQSGGSQYYNKALRWDANSATTVTLADLPVPAGEKPSPVTRTINRFNIVGGTFSNALSGGSLYNARAVLWKADGSIVTLNSLLPAGSEWNLITVDHVSDTGLVTGRGSYDPAGEQGTYWRDFSMLVPFAGTYGQGDANLDTHIDFDDLLTLAQHYGEANPSLNIHVGDFDLNGQVNFDDLLTLAQHYEIAPALVDASQLGSTFATDWAMAQSITPEPGSLLAGFGVLTTLRRRR